MPILSNALHNPRPLRRRARRMTPWPAFALIVFTCGLIWAALLAMLGLFDPSTGWL